MSIDREFAPYQESFELKELGFDEPCLGWFQESNYGTEKVHIDSYWKTHLSGLEDEDFLPAPTFSQAFRWFREKYKLHTEIRSYTAKYFTIIVQECKDIVRFIEYGGGRLKFNTYEEAELACLRKLIEIVKNKS